MFQNEKLQLFQKIIKKMIAIENWRLAPAKGVPEEAILGVPYRNFVLF